MEALQTAVAPELFQYLDVESSERPVFPVVATLLLVQLEQLLVPFAPVHMFMATVLIALTKALVPTRLPPVAVAMSVVPLVR